MRQQVLEFVLDESAGPQRVPVDRRAVAEVVRYMAAAIVAVCEEGVDDPDDDESSSER